MGGLAKLLLLCSARTVFVWRAHTDAHWWHGRKHGLGLDDVSNVCIEAIMGLRMH